jgi:hypothetical protein
MFSIAKIRIFLFILVVAPLARCQDQAVFFYSSEFDICDWLGNSIPAANNTERGGLCAYEESTQRVYACPAPGATCWTFGQTCGKGIGSAGPNQIACNNDGDVWCCAGDETCTLNPNQVNVCISNFTNHNANVQPSAAVSAEYAALGVTSVGTVAPTGKTKFGYIGNILTRSRNATNHFDHYPWNKSVFVFLLKLLFANPLC